MNRAPSLRRRLILWLILSTALIGAIALVDTRIEALRIAQGVSDRVLAGSAMAIAERVTPSDDGGLDVEVPFSALEMLSSTAQDLVFYRVDGPQGVITGYDDLPVAEPAGTGAEFADITYNDTVLRAATIRRSLATSEGNVTFRVTVAESTLARAELGQAILLRSALRLAILILAAAAIAWVVVTLALRPLTRVGAAMAARQAGDLGPINARVPREVAPLVDSIDGFMGRLDAAMGALRRFTSNANHQIRTPLATARTHLALAGRSPAARPGSLAKADAALIRAERVLAQLLLLARLDGEGERPAPVPCDIAALAREIAAESIPRAVAAGQDLGYDGPDSLMVRSEPVLLGEALRNLVDNALTHTPAGTIVTLRVGARDGAVVVTVADDGPGLPPGAEAALSGTGGIAPGAEHGLGLSIVRDIARLVGARVIVGQGPDFERSLAAGTAASPDAGPEFRSTGTPVASPDAGPAASPATGAGAASAGRGAVVGLVLPPA